MARIYQIGDISNSKRAIQFVTPNSRVLEFGAANGAATRYMKETLNCKVTAIELIPEMAEIGAQYAEKMIISDIDFGNWENEIEGKFDYIVFGDVLEHLRYPDLAIQKASKYLAEEGYICTSVPNLGHNAIMLSLRKGIFNYSETGLLDNTHIHFFTRNSLFSMFEKQGFSCVEENDVMVFPRRTELKEYYIKQPLFSLNILFRRDGHVFQFQCKWKKTGNEIKHVRTKGIRPGLIEIMMVIFNEIKFGYFIRK